MDYDIYVDEWIRLYNEEELSVNEIARRYKVAARTVLRRFDGLVELRPKSPYEQYLDEWYDLYVNHGYTKTEIANKYDTTVQVVMHLLKKRGIMPQESIRLKYKHLMDEWVQKYVSGMPLEKIGEEFGGITAETVRQYLERAGIETRSYSEAIRKYEINDEYFDVIDTPIKAYHLGIMFSTGSHIVQRSYHAIDISIKSKEREIVDKLISVIGSTHEFEDKDGHLSIRYSSKHMQDILIKWGLGVGKYTNVTMPLLPEHLLPAFILGYWEGRGSFPINGEKAYIYFTGTIDFLTSLREILKSLVPEHRLKTISQVKKITNYRMSLFGAELCNQVLQWMYRDYDFYTPIRVPSFFKPKN